MEKVKSVYLVVDGNTVQEYPTKKALQKAFTDKSYSANAAIWKGKPVQITTQTIQQITIK